MDIEKEVKGVMSELHSGRGSSLYSALIMLRTTLIKSRPAVDQLVMQGAIKLMIQLLDDRRRHVNQTKTTDIVMSILANLCMEADVRTKVMNSDGLSVIARVTLNSDLESIQNRGIRAIANLAQDISFREKIISLEVPAFIAKKLMATEDGECQATYCRALRLLGQSDKGVKRLVEDTQAVQALAALLKLDNKKLALKSLRTLSEFSAWRCCSGFTGQILAANVLEELVVFADDDDNDAAFFALSIILRLCEQELMRPALGSAGVISLLVKLMASEKSYVDKISTLNALCLCTKEAVNRKKIYDVGGLEIFVSALEGDRIKNRLSTGRFSVLYDRIISSIVNFLYNDDCFSKLLDLGLVKVLLKHLERCCQFTCTKENLRNDIELLAETFDVPKKREIVQAESKTEINMLSKENVAASEMEDAKAKNLIDAAEDLDNLNQKVVDDSHVNAEIKNDSFETELYIDPVIDPLIIDANRVTNKDGVVVDADRDDDDDGGNLSSSDGTVEMPLPPSTMSRNTFSINSPTYQAETSWKIEDYTSGVTCKTFTPERESMQHASPNPSHPYMEGSVQAPYSPLSASASYYSPAQSSPSHASLSPMQSSSPLSPGSGSNSNQSSPVRSLNSPGVSTSYSPQLFSPQYNSPSRSPHSTYQSQFSPLSNAFPSSPLQSFAESGGQSPVFNSQMSLFSQSGSQESSLPFQEPLSRVPGLFSEHLGHELLSSSQEDSQPNAHFFIVPLAQDNNAGESPVYSTSEEDDVDDDYSNDGSNLHKIPEDQRIVFQETTPSVTKSSAQSMDIQDKPEELNSKCFTSTTDSSIDKLEEVDHNSDPRNSVQSLPRCKLMSFCNSQTKDIHKPKKGHPCENSKNAAEVERETVNRACNNHQDWRETESMSGKIFKTEHHSSIDFIPQESTREFNTQLTKVSNESSPNSLYALELEEKEQEILLSQSVKGLGPSFPTENQRTAIQRSNSSDLKDSLSEPVSKGTSLKHLYSYPGKRKLPTVGKDSYKFMKIFSPLSPITNHGSLSPYPSSHQFSIHGMSPLISDSPYRSPIPEPLDSPREELKGVKRISRNSANSNCLRTEALSASLKGNKSTCGGEPSSSTQNLGTESSSAFSNRSNQHEMRVKKILKTTESNILILLSRISLKTNPTLFLADPPVISCLLRYLSCASNPVQRCCRILNRLCSNLLTFERLILIQTPALIVKFLVVEGDSAFPSVMFCNEWENQFGILQRSRRNLSDFLPSSQCSDISGSQASDFGRKMDFEFEGDAYSRINTGSVGALFRNHPSLSVDSQAARDGAGADVDIYEAGSSRTEVRVHLGLGLIRTLGSVAMSRYGEGEVQHLLTRRTLPEKLACIISLLYLPIGWGHFTRRQFILKYNLWEQILPYLFIPEGPLAREAIVTALSLNLHLDNPPKKVKKMDSLLPCPDVSKSPRVPASGTVSMVKEKSGCSRQVKVGLKNIDSDQEMFFHPENDCANFRCSEQSSGEENSKIENKQLGETLDNDVSIECPYLKLSLVQDVFFIVGDGQNLNRFGVNREIMTQKSEVFAAMLGGSYAESSMSEIVLQDVNPGGFEFVLHYLHGCTAGCIVIDSYALEDLGVESSGPSITTSETDEMVRSEHVMLKNMEEVDKQRDFSFYSLKESDSGEMSYSNEEMVQALNASSIASQEKKSEKLEDKDSSQLRLDTHHNLSLAKDPLLSDPLDCLTTENDLSGQECVPSRKLNFDRTPETCTSNDIKDETVGLHVSTTGEVESDAGLKRLENLINKYSKLLTLADRFLLKELIDYVASVLSHICLTPQTCEEIFYLACFYKLDLLGVDCIRAALLSHLPCHEMANILVDLGDSDYKEQASSALLSLLYSSVTD